MSFNLAFAKYKLKDPSSTDFMRLWREQIKDIYYKTLAQFNLAVVTFYQNLAHHKAVTLDSVNETLNHFDFTMSQINQMMNSFLNPASQQQLPIPPWLNLDQLISTCRSLFNRLKPKVEALPPQPVSTPEDEFQAVMQ
jgi:hypothetical protein